MSRPERSPYAVGLDDLEQGARVRPEDQVTETDGDGPPDEPAELFPQDRRPWALG